MGNSANLKCRNWKKNKRRMFAERGCDVESYEREYYNLVRQRRDESVKARDIWECERITLEYNQKIKDLARKYLDVEFDIVIKINE